MTYYANVNQCCALYLVVFYIHMHTIKAEPLVLTRQTNILWIQEALVFLFGSKRRCLHVVCPPLRSKEKNAWATHFCLSFCGSAICALKVAWSKWIPKYVYMWLSHRPCTGHLCSAVWHLAEMLQTDIFSASVPIQHGHFSWIPCWIGTWMSVWKGL